MRKDDAGCKSDRPHHRHGQRIPQVEARSTVPFFSTSVARRVESTFGATSPVPPDVVEALTWLREAASWPRRGCGLGMRCLPLIVPCLLFRASTAGTSDLFHLAGSTHRPA